MSMFPFLGGYGTRADNFTVDLSSYGAYGSRLGPGTVISNLIAIYPAGGTPPYTYAVDYVSGDGASIIQSGNTVKFSDFIDLIPYARNSVFSITVTDANGATGVVPSVPVTLETYLNSGGMIP